MNTKIEYQSPIHESGEDYLEKILMLSKDGKTCRSVDLAAAFGYSRPAISRAVHTLSSNGYLTIGEKGVLLLTEEGMKRAMGTLHRHKILTDLFVSLGIDPEIAETDACRIEHVLHEETFQALSKIRPDKDESH